MIKCLRAQCFETWNEMDTFNLRILSGMAICTTLTIATLVAVAYLLIAANSGKLERAMALNEHGYNEAARLELIDLIYGPASYLLRSNEDRAGALHMLGQISLEDDELAGTLSAWGLLVKEFPDSELAQSVQEDIAAIEVDYDRLLSDLDSSVEATRYLEIADWWLTAAEIEDPHIDVSDISADKAILHWFNLIIESFPGTTHAKLAFERQFEYLLGNGSKITLNRFSSTYKLELEMSKIAEELFALRGAYASESIFSDYVDSFPNSDKLQRIRYLIGQSYWVGGETDNARRWFTNVIEDDRDANTYYQDLAARRLQQLSDLQDSNGIDD